MDFSYHIEKKENHAIITMKGMLMDKSPAIKLLEDIDGMVKDGLNHFVISLAEIDYMNSSGLNTLVNILTKARTKGGEVVVANVSEKVKQLFLITKLNTLFTISDSVEEAEKFLI